MKVRKELTSRWIFDSQDPSMYMSAAVVQPTSDISAQQWHLNICNNNYSDLSREEVEYIRDFLAAILADSED